ncbi:MAG: hypothetical protein IPI01_16580 [Ignavibacteriae bacterium]|nr:hypothetical protein [Ignavibacteriota bacterium]
MFGFYLSYLGYFALPAVGPRYTLHDFNSLDAEIPGLWLTPALQLVRRNWESIPMGVSSAAAMAATQRDVFPSGHTTLTLVLMWMAIALPPCLAAFCARDGCPVDHCHGLPAVSLCGGLIGGALFAVAICSSPPAVRLPEEEDRDDGPGASVGGDDSW